MPECQRWHGYPVTHSLAGWLAGASTENRSDRDRGVLARLRAKKYQQHSQMRGRGLSEKAHQTAYYVIICRAATGPGADLFCVPGTCVHTHTRTHKGVRYSLDSKQYTKTAYFNAHACEYAHTSPINHPIRWSCWFFCCVVGWYACVFCVVVCVHERMSEVRVRVYVRLNATRLL